MIDLVDQARRCGTGAPRCESPTAEAGLPPLLARVYVLPEARRRFLADPAGEVRRAGLAPDACEALSRIHVTGMALAATTSFEKKRIRRAQG